MLRISVIIPSSFASPKNPSASLIPFKSSPRSPFPKRFLLPFPSNILFPSYFQYVSLLATGDESEAPKEAEDYLRGENERTIVSLGNGQGSLFPNSLFVTIHAFYRCGCSSPSLPSFPSTILASSLEGIPPSSSSPSPNPTVTLTTSPNDDARIAAIDAPCSPPISLQRLSPEPLGASPTAVSSVSLGIHPLVPIFPLTLPFSFEVGIQSDSGNTFPLASGSSSSSPVPIVPESNASSSSPRPKAKLTLSSPLILSSQMEDFSPPPTTSSSLPLPPPFVASIFPEELGSPLENMDRTLQLVSMIITLPLS